MLCILCLLLPFGTRSATVFNLNNKSASLTEPGVKFSFNRLFNYTHLTVYRERVEIMVDPHLGQRVLVQITKELLPVVAFPLASSVEPLEDGFAGQVTETGHRVVVAAYPVVAYVAHKLGTKLGPPLPGSGPVAYLPYPVP